MIIPCFSCGGGTKIDPTYAGEKYCNFCGDDLGFVDSEEQYVPYWDQQEEYEPLAPKVSG